MSGHAAYRNSSPNEYAREANSPRMMRMGTLHVLARRLTSLDVYIDATKVAFDSAVQQISEREQCRGLARLPGACSTKYRLSLTSPRTSARFTRSSGGMQ